MPDPSHTHGDTTPAAQLRRMSEALAAARNEASDRHLLELVARELMPPAEGVLALLIRDDTGTVQVAAVAPAGTDDAATLLLAGVDGTDDLTDAVLQARVAAAGLHTVSTVPLAVPERERGGDTLLLFGRGPSFNPAATELDNLLRVAAALLSAARALRSSRRRETALRDQLARAALDGRELAHQLNNDLTMPVGVIELLLDRSSFAPELRDMLQAAAHDLATLERHIRTFHSTVRAEVDVVAHP
jgi:hypothetical protein